MDEIAARAPGRVNLIGEHLDYNGGRCLPIAIRETTRARIRRRDDSLVEVTSGELSWTGTAGEQATGWAAYVVGVLWALDVTVGLEIVITSEVPIGAGLSSSAALECSVAMAVDEALGLGRTREELMLACVRAETEYVGAPTGGLDQRIAMFAEPQRALLLDFADGSRQPVPFEPEAAGLRLLVVDTRVRHALTEGGYGARRADCEAAARLLGVGQLATATPAAVAAVTEERLRRRVRHVVTEQQRVTEFVAATGAADWARAGALMTASHRSLRDDFEVSCEELDLAVEVALGQGALGARMTGGGFGGSAIALLPEDRVEQARAATTRAFADQGWRAPAYLLAEASGPAVLLQLG